MTCCCVRSEALPGKLHWILKERSEATDPLHASQPDTPTHARLERRGAGAGAGEKGEEEERGQPDGEETRAQRVRSWRSALAGCQSHPALQGQRPLWTELSRRFG